MSVSNFDILTKLYLGGRGSVIKYKITTIQTFIQVNFFKNAES